MEKLYEIKYLIRPFLSLSYFFINGAGAVGITAAAHKACFFGRSKLAAYRCGGVFDWTDIPPTFGMGCFGQ